MLTENNIDCAAISRTDSTSLCAKKIFIGDIRDQEFLSSVMRSWRPNILFHLAATKARSLTQSAFERSLDVNLVGTLRLLFHAAAIVTLEIGRASCRERGCQYD